MPVATPSVPTRLPLPAQAKAQINAATRANGLSPHAHRVRALLRTRHPRQSGGTEGSA